MVTVECHQIKCPDFKSYDEHLRVMDQIIDIALTNKVCTEVIESTRKTLTITFQSKFVDTLNQVEAIIAIMGLLSREGIIPGEVVKTWPIKNQSMSVKEVIKKIEGYESKNPVSVWWEKSKRGIS